MALIPPVVVNTILCSACRTSIVPNRKPDGGVVFGAALVHAVKPRLKRDLCGKHGYLPPVAPAAPAPTREERRQAKWAARDAADLVKFQAQRDADDAAFKAFFDRKNAHDAEVLASIAE